MSDTLATLLEERIRTRYEGRQAAFARATGLSAAYVNHIVQGKIGHPRPEVRRMLASELGMRHIDLLVLLGELEPEELGAQPAALPPDEARLLAAYRALSPSRQHALGLVAEELAGDSG